ncbi:M48 family metalloprotease [Simkania negevensis]|uniref:M48 family metalloprotease n=1 Tax=Simkania negevensis TaxID=83561 RepID=A0ABS3APN4_9BACT|nr:M48 family metalloprotease [Simkania negevensis]
MVTAAISDTHPLYLAHYESASTISLFSKAWHTIYSLALRIWQAVSGIFIKTLPALIQKQENTAQPEETPLIFDPEQLTDEGRVRLKVLEERVHDIATKMDILDAKRKIKVAVAADPYSSAMACSTSQSEQDGTIIVPVGMLFKKKDFADEQMSVQDNDTYDTFSQRCCGVIEDVIGWKPPSSDKKQPGSLFSYPIAMKSKMAKTTSFDHMTLFTLGHEVAHLKHRHGAKYVTLKNACIIASIVVAELTAIYAIFFIPFIATLIAPAAILALIAVTIASTLALAAIIYFLLKYIIVYTYSRMQEKEADLTSAKVTKAAIGGILNFTSSLTYHRRLREDQKASLYTKLTITPAGNNLLDFEHPWYTTRIAYLKEFFEEQTNPSKSILVRIKEAFASAKNAIQQTAARLFHT